MMQSMEDLKRIFHLVGPYRKRVAAAAVISLAVSGLNAALAWLVKPAMDNIFISKDARLLLVLPVGVFLLFLFKGILTFFHEYLMRSAAQKMVMNLRNRLLGHAVGLPLGYYGKNSSGELISRVINDTAVLQELVSLTIKDLFIETFSVIALTAVAIWRRWDLTLISIIVLPSAFYVVGRLGRRMKQISRRTQEKISSITEFLNETFSGIKIIKAFNRQADQTERFRLINRDFYRENMRATRVSEASSLMMEAVGGLGIAFVMWYGARLIINNVITVGDFTSFLTAVFLIYTPARRLARINIGIQQATAPLARIDHLFSEAQEKDGDVILPAISSSIDIQDVSFTYPSEKHKALDSIRLTIRKGEIVAFVGKSGGGKTTLVNLLPGFFRPTEGKICIDGIDISTATFPSLRGQFGIVSQEVVLFNDTVRANIAYGKPEASLEEIVSAAKAAYAHDFIAELPQGYNTIVGERGMRLSGGQRQRLSIARAILRNPPILILDEATSSLDTASEMMVQRAMENLMMNRTTLVIAHRLSTIKRADRIVVIDRGRIAESGTHEELYGRGGIYGKLYEMQFSGQER